MSTSNLQASVFPLYRMSTHTVLHKVKDTFIELWCRHVCQALSKDMACLSCAVVLCSMGTPPSPLRCCLSFFEWCFTVLGFPFLLSPMGVLEVSWRVKSLLSCPYALNFKSASAEFQTRRLVCKGMDFPNQMKHRGRFGGCGYALVIASALREA